MTAKETESKAAPFVLGEGIPPVPARVVARIWKREYIDMADLLRDNLEAERRSMVQGTSPLARLGQSKPLCREIPDVLSWAQCFGAYIGVVVENHPEPMKHPTRPQIYAKQGGAGGERMARLRFHVPAVSRHQ